MKRFPKASVLYLHAPQGLYNCGQCGFFQTPNRCLLHGSGDDIKVDASCGYFLPGPKDTFGGKQMGWVTKQESGYTEAVQGASCGRCEYFNPEGDCHLVDKRSPGDDEGTIDKDACCVLWEAC